MYLFSQGNFMYYLKQIFYLFSLILILVSCAGREKHPSSLIDYSSNAPFIVEQITKPENLVKSINFIEKDGLKDTFIVNLSTCLKDSFKKDNSIQETPFIIEYENNLNSDKRQKIKIQVTSDVNGCIRWEERYKYRYVIQSKWILLERTIKKENGAYSGQVNVPLAVNPWLDIKDEKFPEVLDLRTNYSEKYPIFKEHPYEKNGLEYLSKDEPSKYPQLWAPEVGVQIEKQLSEKKQDNGNIKSLLGSYQAICNSEVRENCYKRHLKISLTVPLRLRTYSLQKDLVDEDVKGGSYNVSLQLLSIPDVNKKAYRMHENVCTKDIYITYERGSSQRTKYINISCDIPISYFSQHANYKLALEIDPKQGLPFTKFQGIYTINLTREIKSGSLSNYTIDNDVDNYYKKLPTKVAIVEDMKIKYIYNAIKDEENKSLQMKKLSNLGFDPAYLDVKLIRSRFSNVKNNEVCSDNETVVKRKVQFIGEACIQDILTDYQAKKIKFRIFVEDENTNEIREVFANTKGKEISETDSKGCIHWPDVVEHKNFNRQVYFPRKVHFLSEELNLYGVTSVAVNPWQRAFQSYQNISQINPNEIRTDTKGVKKPEIVINQFKSVNLFPSYILDKFLNIHIFHSLYFLFQPFITRLDDVSWGSKHGGRELLRDGYYILRVLLLRNPQETEDISRVILPETIKKIRGNPLPEKYYKDSDYINKMVMGDIKGKYITHIDTIIKASANFINIYTPLYFTMEQFFYLASRNLISIQVIPVDPEGLKFKELSDKKTTCEIDLKKTVWKPYFDHDLITKPYVGVFQTQNWTNWNILQSVADNFNTDEIIDSDEVGKKYRHFNLHPDSMTKKNSKINISKHETGSCISEEDHPDDIKNSDDIKPCDLLNVKNKNTGASIHYQREIDDLLLNQEGIEEKISSEDLIDSFAEVNSLKVINLYEEGGHDFINDLNYSFSETNPLNDEEDPLDVKIIDAISDQKMKKEIKSRIEKNCETSPIKDFIFNSRYRNCLNKVLETYLYDLIKEQNADVKAKNFDDLLDLEAKQSEIQKIIQMIMDKQELPSKVSSLLMNKVSKSLEKIIDKGISNEDKKDVEILTFAKSLCKFWFDSFFDKYLKAREMRAAYTNYIRKFDYYRVLENDSLNDTEKGDFIISFMDMISDGETNGEKALKKCHTNYGNCILVDHCKLRDHSRHSKTRYCDRASRLKDSSCLKVVKEECQKDLSTSICQREIRSNTCHSSLNNFCKINLNHRMCKKYYSRCLTGYYSCMESNDITEDFEKSVKDIDLLKAVRTNKWEYYSDIYSYYANMYAPQKRPIKSRVVLESCLKDPFKFFQFDFKMFIEEISDTPSKYVEGFAGNLGVTGGFSTGSYMNWTSQRSTSAGVKHGVGMNFPIPGINVTALDIHISKSISSNVSNSGRRAIDIRVNEGAFLVTSRATFDIDVVKFKKCLIIKPNPNAFFAQFIDGLWKPYNSNIWNEDFRKNPYKKIILSRPGLMVCNPKKELQKNNPETIRESYYYISQSMIDPSNSQFLNLYDLANRPFMAILRGRQEFLNYFNSMKTIMEGSPGDIEDNTKPHSLPDNMFIDYPHPLDEIISFSLSQREFQETGFHPGVYTYVYSEDDFNYDFINRNGLVDKAFKLYEKVNYYLPLIRPPNVDIPAQKYPE